MPSNLLRTMTREEHLAYCTQCTKRAFDPNKGVTCGLTQEIANFDPTCSNYEQDEEVHARSSGIAIPLGVENGGSIRVDEATLQRLKGEQDLNFAIIAGLIAAILSAIVWAAITVKTGYQIGYMAVGLGAAVGLSVRYAGKGLDPIYQFVGAGLALFGCLLGNFLGILGFVSAEVGSSWIGVLDFVSVGDVLAAMADGMSPIDFLFYGIAIYEGFRFSLRTFDVPHADEELN